MRKSDILKPAKDFLGVFSAHKEGAYQTYYLKGWRSGA